MVLTFSFASLDVLSKAYTCPFTDSDVKDSFDMGYSGTGAPLSTGEQTKSWLSSLRIICKSPLPCVGSHTVFQGSKVNNENCKVGPGVGQ